MVSIRLFLTMTLIAILVMVSFLSSLRGYRQSMLEAERLFDLQLLEHAQLLGLLHPGNTQPERLVMPEAAEPLEADRFPAEQMMLAWQIFDRKGVLTLRSENAPPDPMVPLEAGYREVNFAGYRWRAVVLRNAEDGHWILTAQRSDVRYRLAESVILEAVIPTVLSIPLAGLFIWLVVGWGLRPISQLAREVRSREASDLTAVRLDDIPRELTPLTRSTNDLLRRLQSSFAREKRFAADAAHELRTPISVLKVQVHNLLTELHEPGTSLEELREGIDAMGHLVEQILILNRTAPDQYMVNFMNLDLYKLGTEVVSSEFEMFLKKNQHFEMEGEPSFVRGDATALRSLLQNILSNASKYTPQDGRIQMRISPAHDRVLLQLEDSGPGIPASHYERVFDRFYRLDGDRHASDVSGSGLGLAIVRHIVEMHNASVTLARSPTLGGLCVCIVFHASPEGIAETSVAREAPGIEHPGNAS